MGVTTDGILKVSGSGAGAAVDIVSPIGQDTMANSVSVVIASNQTPIDVNATLDKTGLATEAKQDDQIAQLSEVIGTSGVVAPAKVVVIGVVNNGDGTVRPLFYNSATGFVQVDVSGIDANLSSRASEGTLGALEAKFGTLGQKVMAGSTPVVIASDQSVLGVTAVNLDIRDLVFATDKVDVSGSIVDTELPAAVLLADNTVNPTVPGVASFGMVYDGATWDRDKKAQTGVLFNSFDRLFPMGVLDDVFKWSPVVGLATNPTAIDFGLVTRNIPSGTQDVSATDLDIRDLTFTTDKVDVSGSTVLSSALVSSDNESYTPGNTEQLSINQEGQLRVVTVHSRDEEVWKNLNPWESIGGFSFDSPWSN